MSDSSFKPIRKLTPKGSAPDKVVFLFDVDNTLLDNDRVTEDLKHHLEKEVGLKGAQCYWNIFEELRDELGYADYLGALQRYRSESQHDPRLLTVSHFLINYPFADRLFPHSLDVVEGVKQWGPAVTLSDGDVVFQPLKVERSGLFKAVNGNVLVYVHKEQELDDVAQHFPADHYVIVDDKLRILAAIKKVWGPRVTTIFVRQGHYALDPKIQATYPAADVSIERIGDLLNHDLQVLFEDRQVHKRLKESSGKNDVPTPVEGAT
jgi:FMN phosphatase YigB (HAD superfamily)